MTGYLQANLRDLIEARGEADIKAELSEFLCPLNPDVESFIRDKAILFARQGIASTHVVYASFRGEPVIAGYYALAIKTVTIKSTVLKSRIWKSRLSRFTEYHPELKSYIGAMPLIGQLGKNYANDYNKLITGDDLLEIACQKVRSAQYMLSGKLVYLECEDKPELITFYERNGFTEFNRRKLDGDEQSNDGKDYLLQMIKYFKG